MPSDRELVERAYRAWLGYRPKPRPPTPTLSASTVEEWGGRTYVVLRSGGQVVDIYRYTNEGQLRLLRRNWPGPYGRRTAGAAA